MSGTSCHAPPSGRLILRRCPSISLLKPSFSFNSPQRWLPGTTLMQPFPLRNIPPLNALFTAPKREDTTILVWENDNVKNNP